MIQSLFAHQEWADAIVWRAVLHAADDQLLREKLYHIHMTQHGFLAVWTSAPFEYRPEIPPRDALYAYARSVHDQLRAFTATIDESALDMPVTLPWAPMFTRAAGREPAQTTYAETLQQLVMHSTYHRGQVNLRLRELATEPPLVDYIAWLWLGRPAAQWRAA
jgi:uncharacterized damage-inducible protein DinB